MIQLKYTASMTICQVKIGAAPTVGGQEIGSRAGPETRDFLNKKMQKFLNDLDELFQILLDARSSYEIWWIYVNRDSRKRYFNIFLRYKEFFETIGNALFSTMLISLYKILEVRDDTMHLSHLIKDATRLKIINDADIKVLGQIINNAKPIWKKVCILRSKQVAHKNKELTMEQIYGEAHLTPDQLKELTDLDLKILNYIAVKAGQREHNFDGSTTQDTNNILNTLISEEIKIFKNKDASHLS